MMRDYNKITQDLLKDASFLQGQYVAMQDEKKDVFSKVEKAKKWLDKQPDYVKFLQHFQNIFHQKNIGTFSELLTFFVQDILEKDRQIALDLYTYHNLPALRIESINKGFRENIYEGNGGSIANIVSTGLRLIALSRLPHRKFIILDEPDCWLEPRHIPLFAQIIGEISQKLKIQTIIISHHSWEYFKNYGRVISLEDEGGLLKTSIIHDVALDGDAPKDYIEKIHLRRFMSHYNTVYDLHPYLTCIVGTNNIGKSVIATAMKAVAYADSADSYIMHNEGEAQVQVDLTQERTILWERFKQTTQDNPQKVKYTLYKNGSNISEFSAANIPEFIHDELNIAMTEDIDVHIGSQKQPVFLLSPDVKPQQKAKILSLGKESLIIQRMMENLKDKTKTNRQAVKEGEKRYAELTQKLKALENIDSLVNEVEELKTEWYTIEKRQESLINLNLHIEQMRKLEQGAKLEPIGLMASPPMLVPTDEMKEIIVELRKHSNISKINLIPMDLEDIYIEDTQELYEIIQRLKYHQKIINVNKIDVIENGANLKDTEDLHSLIIQMKKFESVRKIEKVETVSFESDTQHHEGIAELVENLKFYKSQIEDLSQKKTNIEGWRVIIEQESEKYLAEFKNLCPTCHQGITKDHILGEHQHDGI